MESQCARAPCRAAVSPARLTQVENVTHLLPERSAVNNEFGFGEPFGQRCAGAHDSSCSGFVHALSAAAWSVVAPQQKPDSPLKKKNCNNMDVCNTVLFLPFLKLSSH